MGHLPMDYNVNINPQSSKYSAKAAGMMGLTAELLAIQHEIPRKDQDHFALRSHQKRIMPP